MATQNPVEEHILGAVRSILRDALPQVEEALVRADGLQAARLAISVAWLPDEETGELELVVSGKSTLPTTKTTAKSRIISGQLALL